MKERLREKFFRYVQVNTQANDSCPDCPSSPGQRQLAQVLHEELKRLDLQSELSPQSYVYAHIPASKGYEQEQAVGFLAHLDTATDASGEGVLPQVHRSYKGDDLQISKETVISPKQFPELFSHLGHDLVTASGKTLLGADNKAGIAIIMTFLEDLQFQKIPHGPIYIAFTPDEEIGRGVNHLDLQKFKANYAYTIDGDILGSVQSETFNADKVIIDIEGLSVHPGSAKNKMANAVTIASELISSWPERFRPETTEAREGFIGFMSVSGGVEKAHIEGIVRHHHQESLEQMEKLLTAIVEEKKLRYPLSKITLSFKEQYKNMGKVLEKNPQVMNRLLSAMESLGIKASINPVRGGTDGARLSFMGVPTPNIFVGGSNFHGPFEWVSLDSMQKCVELLIALVLARK